MNGGLQVVNPSTAIYNQILDYMEHNAIDMDFADQSLLSSLYRGRWVPLPYIYNALKTLRWEGVHSQIWQDESVKNVHYILAPKPWDKGGEKGQNESDVVSHKWWRDLNAERLEKEKEQGIQVDGF